MFSFQLLKTAFYRVQENHGCAGVDGVTIERFEEELDNNLKKLQRDINDQTYSPLPLLKILVDKGNDQARALCVPIVRDRTAQTAALAMIEPVLDAQFEDCSFAYRKGRSVKQAIYKIKEYYEHGYEWVVNADIDRFFDNINHSIIFHEVRRFIHEPYLQTLIEKWIKAEVWDGRSIKVLKKGIPQGGPISPIMANLLLDKLDEELMKQKFKIIRFADDFVILCKNKQKAEKGLKLSKEILHDLMLKLDDENIVTFDQGFNYLGAIFIRSMILKPFEKPKREHKVLYYPKPLNIGAYLLKKKRGW